jgi:hypothetical protein
VASLWQEDFERICVQLGVKPERPKPHCKTKVKEQLPPSLGTAPMSSSRANTTSYGPGDDRVVCIIDPMDEELPLVPRCCAAARCMFIILHALSLAATLAWSIMQQCILQR